ncbi:MAG: DUF2188 domain-containing protein, partial [Methyloceanibacter sp.]
ALPTLRNHKPDAETRRGKVVARLHTICHARCKADGPPVNDLEPMNDKEWHVEYGPNPFSVTGVDFLWRLRDEKGWFELWSKQQDAWNKARSLARRHQGRAILHGKDGSVRLERSWVRREAREGSDP